VADGVTDDTVAVQAAINAAASSRKAGVYFAPGTYLCRPLTLPPGVVLKGLNGQGYMNATPSLPNTGTLSRLKLHPSAAGSLLSPDDSGVHATHVRISDLALDAGGRAQRAIDLPDHTASVSRFWIVERCYVANSGQTGSGYAVYVGNLNTACTLRDCVVFNGTSGARGGGRGVGWYGQDGLLDNCFIGYFADAGLTVLGGAADQTFTMRGGGVFTCTTGIVVGGRGPVFDGVSIDHNYNDGAYVGYDASFIGCVFHTNSIQNTNTWDNVHIAAGNVTAVACRSMAPSGEAGGKVPRYFFHIGAGATLSEYGNMPGAATFGTGWKN
jgi:hypothetical protein